MRFPGPRFWAAIGAGVAVGVALGISFANVWVGLTLGGSVAIVFLWESRLHR